MSNTPDDGLTEVPNDEIATPAQDPVETADDQGVVETKPAVLTTPATPNLDPDPEEHDPLLDGPTELDSLKARAKALGLKHSNNINVDTLRAKIDEHVEALEAKRQPTQTESDIARQGEVAMAPQPVRPTATQRNKLPPLSVMLEMTVDDLMRQPERKRKMIIRARQMHTEMALVRCQIYNNNPAKNDLHGEIFSVQNKYLGVVRKYIPYGEFTDNGYHVPRILVNMLRTKKYIQTRSIKNPDGTERVEHRHAPEFTINELRPLTVDELKQLANMQGARGDAQMGMVGLG